MASSRKTARGIRNRFPAQLFFLLFGIAVFSSTTKGAPPSDRPNVLLILSDDHAAYAQGAYGSGIAWTPHLDRLAAGGSLFSRAYSNSPMCTPSRQSLITGKYPFSSGVTLLQTALSEEELTLAEILKVAGYETAAMGKMHFNSQLKHGFELRVDRPEYRRHLKENPPAPLPEGTPALGPWRPFRDHARVWLNGSYLPYPARHADMLGTFLAGEAIGFLKKEHRRPFFLVVSFYEPHSPFHFPIEYAGKFDPEKIPVPEVGPEDHSQIPLIFRDLAAGEKQRIAASYYTSVEFLDRNIGRVLEALEERGLKDDTLVLYAGDQGYNLGHHGRFEKHCFYEQAVRSPLLASWPGRIPANQSIPDLVEFVDIVPTVLEACRVRPPPGLHGKSFLPLIDGRRGENPYREYAVSFYHGNEEAMVCTERWKLIYCTGKRARDDGYITDDPTPGRYWKLFDLESDPREMRDLSGRPDLAGRIRRMEEVLLERFEAGRPENRKAPQSFKLEEKLDWYLVPPELREK